MVQPPPPRPIRSQRRRSQIRHIEAKPRSRLPRKRARSFRDTTGKITKSKIRNDRNAAQLAARSSSSKTDEEKPKVSARLDRGQRDSTWREKALGLPRCTRAGRSARGQNVFLGVSASQKQTSKLEGKKKNRRFDAAWRREPRRLQKTQKGILNWKRSVLLF